MRVVALYLTFPGVSLYHAFCFAPFQCTAGILANQQKLKWNTKEGEKSANYFGSITQASTCQLGTTATGGAVHVPLKNLMPMVSPNDLVVGGWDISSVRC